VFRDWIGIRPEDLLDANRAELEHDHGLAAVHRAELNLGLQLKGLPATSRLLTMKDVSDYEAEMGPFLPQEGRSAWLYGVPVMVVCLAGLVLLTISNKGARDPLSEGGFLSEGIASIGQVIEGDPRRVSISIEAHQVSGDRSLPQGATLHGFESAKLTVHVAGTGYLSVYDLDESELVYPLNSEPWFVLEGSWLLGEDSSLLFENSQYSSTRNFLAALCERPVVVVDLSAISETLAEEGCRIGTTFVEWESHR